MALVSANLIVVSIKSEVACRKEVTHVLTAALSLLLLLVPNHIFVVCTSQMEKNELYKADLLMFASHMKSDDWVSSLSEKTNDPAERPKILKVLSKKTVSFC